MNLSQEIEARRERVADLQAEITALELAQRVLEEGVGAVVKPPPPVRKERTVRAEAPAEKPARGKGTDSHFACGHPRSGDNLGESGAKQYCKTCKNVQQKAWRDAQASATSRPEGTRKLSKEGDATFACGHPRSDENSYSTNYVSVKTGKRSKTCRTCVLAYQKTGKKDPKPAAEPDPVPPAPAAIAAKPNGLVLTEEERARLLAGAPAKARNAKIIIPVSAPPPAAPSNQVAVANAARWQKQCQALDFDSGKRCSLMAPHAPPHSSSGRTFYTALNPNELPRGRELDERATGGGE